MYVFPTSSELSMIGQEKVANLSRNRLGFQIVPVVDKNAALLEWEQEDNWTGLMGLRGLGGDPKRIKNIGGKRWQVEPGAYGEFATVDELELTKRRQWGTYGSPIDVTDLVMRLEDRLLLRRLDLQEYMIWQLLTTGSYLVTSEDGKLTHADTFLLQTYAAAVPWSTPATSTPLADLRAIQLKAAGKSVSFGADAMIWMNRITANRMMSNTNSNDLAGKRTAGLANILSMGEANQLFTGEALPNIGIYDEGYLRDSDGAFVRYIPDGVGVVVGRRVNGEPIADFAMTRNAQNLDLAPGAYHKIIDQRLYRVPGSIEVHDGFNGGIEFFFPSAVVIATLG